MAWRLPLPHGRLKGLLLLHVARVAALWVAVIVTAAVSAADVSGRPDSVGDSTVRNAYTCEGIQLALACSKGEVVYILNANYGRIVSTICNEQRNSTRNWDLHCLSSTALRVTREQCVSVYECLVLFNATEHEESCYSDQPVSADGVMLSLNYTCLAPSSVSTAWWTTMLSTAARPEAASHVSTEQNQVVNVTSLPTEAAPEALTLKTVESIPDSLRHPKMPPPAESRVSIVSNASTESISALTTPSTVQMQPSSQRLSMTPPATAAHQCSGQKLRGINWPMTDEGATSSMPCRSGHDGSVGRWRCGAGAQWQGSPDTSECTSAKFMELLSFQQHGGNGSEIISRLAFATNSSSILFGGDLKASVDIFAAIAKPLEQELRESRIDTASRVAMDIVQVSSDLLSNKHVEAWQDLDPTNRTRTAAQLLAAIEKSVAAVAESLTSAGRLSIEIEKTACDVQVLASENVTDSGLTIQLGSTSDYLHFSKETLLEFKNEKGLIKVVSVLHDGMQAFLTGTSGNITVSSRVLSATIVAQGGLHVPDRLQLKHSFQYMLTHNASNSNISQEMFSCAFWDFNNSRWSGSGCKRIDGNISMSICECDHLTNFAVLMDVTGATKTISPAHEMSLTIITWIGCIISIICLVLSWLTFQCLKNLSCDRNTIHKNLVFNLCCAEVLFLFGLSEAGHLIPTVCTVVAALLHFLFLSAFAWMCLEGVQLYVMLVEVFEAEKSRICYYYAAGYGIPAMIVAVSAGVDHGSYGSDKFCWLRSDTGFIWSFVGPVAAVIVVNIVMLSIAIYMMCRHASSAASIKAKEQKKSDSVNNEPGCLLLEPSRGSSSEAMAARVARSVEECGAWIKASAVLIVLLGLTWIFGFMYVNKESVVMAYVFTVLNSLQGLFIFLFHCVCNDKVQKEYRKFVRRAAWLPDCMRVQYGGHKGLYNTSSNSSGGSGNNNHSRLSSFKKLLSGNRRKRTSTFTVQPSVASPSARGTSTSNSGGPLDCNSAGEESAFESSQNKQRRFTTFKKRIFGDEYDGVNGDLSCVDASVIDSECVSDYSNYDVHATNGRATETHYAVSSHNFNGKARCYDTANCSDELAGSEPLLSKTTAFAPPPSGAIGKNARSQKTLSTRALLQHEVDCEDGQPVIFMPSTNSFGTKRPLSADEVAHNNNGVHGVDMATDATVNSNCLLLPCAKDSTFAAPDKILRTFKLAPISEHTHL